MDCPICHSDTPADSAFCIKCGTKFEGISGLPFTITRTLSMTGLELQKDQILAGKYKIINMLGRGGMGIVYKAEDLTLKRTIALKFLRPEFLIDTEAKSRFLLEAQAAAAIDHPNICAVFEVNEFQGQTFIAMPFIEGKTLRDMIQAGPLDAPTALSLGVQISDGLAEAHKKGIIHRDIKLANIMVAENGLAKIMDFGLAKLMEGSELTATTKIMGTVAYMSPEQAKGTAVDARTDIWSLGIVLYELLVGHTPFEMKKNQAIIYSILHETPKPLHQVNPSIPISVDMAIDRCLQKEPEDRYPDATSLSQTLRDTLGVLQKETGRTKIWTGIQYRMKRKPWLKVGAALAGLALVAGVILVATGRHPATVPKKAVETGPSAAGGPAPGLPSFGGVREMTKDGKMFTIQPGPGQTVEVGMTGAVIAKKEYDQDRSKRMIGQFVIRDLPSGVPRADIIGQVEPINPGDYLEMGKEPRGTLVLRTDPDEAEIYVDGVLKGRTEVKLILPPKTYRVQAKKRDYMDRVEDIDLRAKDVAVRAFSLVAKTAPSTQSGNLFVDSNPQGAEVFLNGKPAADGKTPVKLTLPPARYKVRIALKDYEEQILDLDVVAGQNIDRSLTLAPATEAVEILSIPPGAEVFVGDRSNPEGTTPLKRSFVPGAYKFRIHKEGFQDSSEEATLAVGAPVKLSVDLKPVPIPAAPPKFVLNLATTPEAGARILINDRDKGVTPNSIELSDPQVRIRLEKPGFKPYEETLTLRSPELEKKVALTRLGRGKLSISAYPKARVEVDGKIQDGTVPPIKIVDVDEGSHKIKFLFDDNVEITKSETVLSNETRQVHCAESEEASGMPASYEISAYPRATLALDSAAKGDIPPVKTLKVGTGGHEIGYYFTVREVSIILKMFDQVERILKKKVHAACESVEFAALEPTVQNAAKGQTEGFVLLVQTDVPLGIDLDGVDRGEAAGGRVLQLTSPGTARVQIGIHPRNAQNRYGANILILRGPQKQALKLTFQIDPLR